MLLACLISIESVTLNLVEVIFLRMSRRHNSRWAEMLLIPQATYAVCHFALAVDANIFPEKNMATKYLYSNVWGRCHCMKKKNEAMVSLLGNERTFVWRQKRPLGMS